MSKAYSHYTILYDTSAIDVIKGVDMKKELGKEAQVGSFNLGFYRWTRWDYMNKSLDKEKLWGIFNF